MIETQQVFVNRATGHVLIGTDAVYPSMYDFDRFVTDHNTERWFMARVISSWERMLPPTCVDPNTGFDDFDMEAFIEKYGALTAQEMFEEGEIDWADETSPVNGRPYLELRLEPSVRA